MPGRNAIKKKDLPREREREREEEGGGGGGGGGVLFTFFYAFQHIKLWSVNRKGKDIFHAIKKAPSEFFLFAFFSKKTTILPSLSVHFEMNMGIIFFVCYSFEDFFLIIDLLIK